MGSPVDVVVLYAPEDGEHHDELVKHLKTLVKQRVIATWSSKQMAVGAGWQEITRRHVHAARVILLLLTADFFAAGLDDLIAQAEGAGAHLVPIRVRDYDWDGAPLRNLHPLPANGKPVTLWPDRDLAWAEIAAAVRHLIAPGPHGTPAGASLPYVPFLRNPGFVGREDDLARLHTLLQEGNAVGVRPAALTGMGGIGKTQLAVEYAYRYAAAYPGGVYWVNAAQPLQAEFARLAVASGLTAGETSDSERTMRLALAFAKHLGERPDALAIFDNVDNPLALRSPEPGFIPEQLGCRLLFTTRRRAPDSPFETVDVRVLPEDVALRLLLGETRRALLDGGPGADLDAAKAICGSVGCLPLALVLAAAFLARYPRIAVADYLKRIRKEGALAAADAAKVDKNTLGTRHDAAVGATLRTQWDALESEDAKLVLKAAALLGEAAVVPRARLSLLTGLAEKAEPGYPAAMEDALLELRGLSLVEELTEHEIRLHPLVREFAAKQIAGREAFAAECAGRLADALWDMGRLHEEVAGRGVDAVLGDLRVGSKLAGASERGRIEVLRRPLGRWSHTLHRWAGAKDPVAFLQMLHNRCVDMGVEEVRVRAEAELADRGRPWLRERIPTSRESDALVRTLEGHTFFVNGVAVTVDGRLAVSASGDKTLKVWDLDMGEVRRTFEGHTDEVHGVAVTADGRFAVSASSDNTLKVWDLGTGQTVRTLEGHTHSVTGVAVTADGRFAVSASDDKTLKVWDLETGQPLRTLEGHTEAVCGVAVTPDGRFAVSASEDKTLKVWDLDTGQALRTLEGHTLPVFGVALTSDGRFAVSAYGDNTLKVWDLGTGQALHTLKGHTLNVIGVAVTSDGRFAISASYDKTLKVWDLDTGQALRTLEGHTESVNGVAVTSDGRFAVSASWDTTLTVWDLDTGQALHTLEGHTRTVSGVAVTSDGRFAVSASEDDLLKVWDLGTGQVVRTLEGHTSVVNGVAVTSDGRFAVSASWDHTLKVWDLDTGQALRTLEGHTEAVNSVAVTSDGRFAVSASDDRTLKVWDLATGQALRTLEGHTYRVTGVAVTLDGRFAVSTSHDRTLKVWDLATGQAVRSLEGHTSGVTGVAVTSDGRFAVSASLDNTLKVWDLDTGQALRTLEGHTSGVNGVAVTSDGRFAVSASGDKTLKVWDLRTGQSLATLEAHAPLYCCAVTTDGKTILAGDEAGALHILDWRPGGA